MDNYIYKNQKKLRCGYTTGTCAAAAVKAALEMLFTDETEEKVTLMTPKGVELSLQISGISTSVEELLEISKYPEPQSRIVTCAIQKDSGDDADVTNGIHIYASVWKISKGIDIDGGIGIGRVTEHGLDQPKGYAAINSVPRKMIAEQVQHEIEAYGYEGGIQVVISAPEGVALANRTFNPRLGIKGGISILGTSGIVEPMSEKALVDTIRTEIQQKTVQGKKDLLIVPGNYGEQFLKETLKIDVEKAVKCSNFIGETIDMAYEFQVRSLLLVGHIGKLVKLGAGIMNTHSKMADGRMEVLASCAVLADVPVDEIKEILKSLTTDEVIAILIRNHALEKTMAILMKRIEEQLEHRAYEGLEIGAITFSKQYGLLGMTSKAEQLLRKHIE